MTKYLPAAASLPHPGPYHVAQRLQEPLVVLDVLGFVLGVASRVDHPARFAAHGPKMLLPGVLGEKREVDKAWVPRARVQNHARAKERGEEGVAATKIKAGVFGLVGMQGEERGILLVCRTFRATERKITRRVQGTRYLERAPEQMEGRNSAPTT